MELKFYIVCYCYKTINNILIIIIIIINKMTIEGFLLNIVVL